MPVYRAISIQEDVKAVECSMEAFRWRKGGLLSADVYFGKEKFIRISFSKVLIFRLVDDVDVASEETERITGIVRQHLFYQIDNAAFWKANSSLIGKTEEQASHYRLITGEHCLDVISSADPRVNVLSVVAR